MKLSALVGGAAEVVGHETSLAEAATRMVDRGTDSLAVVEGRNLVGIITEHDIVVAVADDADPEDESVSDWMSEAPDTVDPDVSVAEAIQWLMQTGYRHLPVMRGRELLGVVGVRDLLWASQSEGSEQ